MGIEEILVIIACSGIVIGVIISSYIRRKKGKTCCGDCSACSSCKKYK